MDRVLAQIEEDSRQRVLDEEFEKSVRQAVEGLAAREVASQRPDEVFVDSTTGI